jgi:amino acid transporter/mannitol/fructose-specific phosphotransferase system IIA component (Ntr-type)
MGKKDTYQFKRDLGLLEVFCIASGAMISSGLFILPSIGFTKAGPGVILSYIIASLLVIPAMLSKAELATAMPKAGGTYFFIERSMGPMMGTIGGIAAWFSLAFKSAFALLGIGIFAVLLNPLFEEYQIKLIAVFFCMLFALINIYGVKETGKTQIILVLSLISILILYIISGIFFIRTENFSNLVPFGYGSVFSTAGLIFVSFGGLTKISSIAEEVKKPGRTIPLGMFLGWGFISLLYVLVVIVTVGVVDPSMLGVTNTPITLGGQNIPVLGSIGGVILSIGAILAFVSTANAGLLAASRDPMAMGKDQLLPKAFAKMSKKGTPIFSIIFTTLFMILVILFLDLEGLVKTASTLKILLFILVILSLIIMRESKIKNYRPKFKSPFYPYIHIAGILGLTLLIVGMGLIPIALASGFIFFGFGWYWYYARDKIWREYSLLHVIERITGIKKTSYLVDEELRHILIDRDDLNEHRFEHMLSTCEIIDLRKLLDPDSLTKQVSKRLSKKIGIPEEKLYKLMKRRKNESSMMLYPGVGIFSHLIGGRDYFEIVIVRSKKGIVISKSGEPFHAFIVVIASPDEKNFYLHSLMWIAQIAEQCDFTDAWVSAEGPEELRQLLLDAWKKRIVY